MALQIPDFKDLYNEFTLPHFIRGQYDEIASKYTEYPACKMFLAAHFAAPNTATVDESVAGVRTPVIKIDPMVLESGTEIQFRTLVKANGNFRFTGVQEKDQAGYSDGFVHSTAPWRHCTFSYTYNDREAKINASSEVQIVNYINGTRAQAFLDAREKLEAALMGKPSSATDNLNPMGISFWLGKGAQGFNGSFAYSSIPGATLLDQTLYPNAKNYTDQWTSISKEDLIAKLDQAFDEVSFDTISEVPVPNKSNKILLTSKKLRRKLTRAAESNNDNLGPDLVAYAGRLTFRGKDIIGSSWMDANDENTIYLIDTGTFKPAFLAGEEFAEFGPYQLTNVAHRDWVVNVDASFNLVCRNPRLNAVLSHT